MQETLHRIHTHNNTQSDVEEQKHSNQNGQSIGTFDTTSDCFLKENLWKLAVSQWQSPKTKIRGSVWNSTKNEFDRLDDLMDSDFTDIVMRIMRFFSRFCFLFNMIVRLFHHLLTVEGWFVWVFEWNNKVFFLNFLLSVFWVPSWGLHLEEKNQWFWNQHPRNANQWDH